MRKREVAPSGTVGNVTSAPVELSTDPDDIGLEFVVEAVGATPTITFKWQGSLVGGANAADWFDLGYITDAVSTEAFTARTVTAIGSYVAWRGSALRRYRFIRLVPSANTNVTYRANIIEYD